MNKFTLREKESKFTQKLSILKVFATTKVSYPAGYHRKWLVLDTLIEQ